MISYRDAVTRVERLAEERASFVEEVPTDSALGRVLAEDVVCPEDVPAFNNSAMDGFALVSDSLLGATDDEPVILPIIGSVTAGESVSSASLGMKPGQIKPVAVEIMTGAPLPGAPFDAVVKVEDVEIIREGSLRKLILRKPVSKGAFVRPRGADFTLGQRVAAEGSRVMPEHLMAFASLGITKLKVRKVPFVAMISTGKELVPADRAVIEPGMIRNSTAPYLRAALSLRGIGVRTYGTVGDDAGDFIRRVERAVAEGADIILSTGAVSMGKHDFVRAAIERMGGEVVFHKCAIRPGKPFLCAELPGGTIFFGMPGNPVSTAVGLRFFVDPYLRRLSGLTPETPLRARVLEDADKPEGFRCFFKSKVRIDQSGASVEVSAKQGSHVVSSMLESNAWVVLGEEGTRVVAGSEVDVYPVHHSMEGARF